MNYCAAIVSAIAGNFGREIVKGLTHRLEQIAHAEAQVAFSAGVTASENMKRVFLAERGVALAKMAYVKACLRKIDKGLSRKRSTFQFRVSDYMHVQKMDRGREIDWAIHPDLKELNDRIKATDERRRKIADRIESIEETMKELVEMKVYLREEAK